MPIMDNVV